MPATNHDNKARQEWLTDTLYAVRGHFRGSKPHVPDDLRTLPSGEEGVIFHCADGKEQETEFLRVGAGQYYDAGKLGNAIAPAGSRKNLEMTAVLRRVAEGTGSDIPAPPRTVLIVGHEKCGANDSLLQAQLDAGATLARPEEAEYMRPMVSATLGDALRQAKDKMPYKELHDEVIRATVLNSMKNVHGYKAGTTPMKELVDAGEVQIVGAVRGFKRQEDGNFPLEVYDPKAKNFVPVEKLYDEAFPGSNRRTDEAIRTRMERRLTDDFVAFKTEPVPTVQHGASSHIRSVNAGIKAQLERLYAAGKDPSPMLPG